MSVVIIIGAKGGYIQKIFGCRDRIDSILYFLGNYAPPVVVYSNKDREKLKYIYTYGVAGLFKRPSTFSRNSVAIQSEQLVYVNNHGEIIRLHGEFNNHIIKNIKLDSDDKPTKYFLQRNIDEKSMIHTCVVVGDTCQIDPEPYLIGYEIIDEYFVKIVKPQLAPCLAYDDIIIICHEN